MESVLLKELNLTPIGPGMYGHCSIEAEEVIGVILIVLIDHPHLSVAIIVVMILTVNSDAFSQKVGRVSVEGGDYIGVRQNIIIVVHHCYPSSSSPTLEYREAVCA